MKRLQEFFNLTYRERNGFLLFTILLFVITLAPTVWSLIRKSDPAAAYSVQVFPENTRPNYTNQSSGKKSQTSLSLQPFDPNRLPAEEWSKLGLSERQIAVIHRYEERGGTFRKKEDVQKMYVIDDALYRQIKPYIRIATRESRSFDDKGDQSRSAAVTSRQSIDAGYAARRSITRVRIDMNRSDTTDWKTIRGIGSTYASRIVRYRELLGGFYHVEQLREVYGLPQERLEEWFSQLYLESPVLRKLRINYVNSSELLRHPYISKKQAEGIVKYRNQHGFFGSLDDMRKIVVLDTDFFAKIESYLDFQQ